ncbi:MAG: hypothetical protein GYA36_21350 [Veillonellaceae bacterium]|nr:hypothetical protein [Veillonellaceae bacterium]
MKKFFLSFILLPALVIVSFCNEPDQIRTHNIIIFQNNFALEYSVISKISYENNQLKFSEKTMLLDCKEYGKWIYYSKMTINRNVEPPLPTNHVQSVTLISTGEKIEIKIIYNEDQKKKKFELTSYPNKKNMTISLNEIPRNRRGFLPFVQENFTESFLNGLAKIMDFSFISEKEQISLFISPLTFLPLCGLREETDEGRIKPIDESEVREPIFLYYNCGFDAQFGYPCSPEEVPAKNPKVLVIEKKQ